VKPPFLLTPSARADIRDILADIADDSPKAATRIRSEILAGFQQLGRSPGIGHYQEELMDRRHRFWVFYSYVVVYRWEVTPVQILAVVHGRRELAAFFNSRSI